MNIRGFLDRSWLMRLVIAMWVVSAVFVMWLLNRIDGIVHGDLYHYGLQFDFAWATPFWSFERLIYVCLAAPLVWSGIALVYDFWHGRRDSVSVVKHVNKPSNGKVQPLRENSMLISCPRCKKVFGKPLAMLDFSGGKAKLVNVCPYCNHVLGSANGEGSKEEEVEVTGLDEEEQEITR